MRMKRLFFALMLIAAGFSLAAEDLRPVNAIVIRHDVSFDMTNEQGKKMFKSEQSQSNIRLINAAWLLNAFNFSGSVSVL